EWLKKPRPDALAQTWAVIRDADLRHVVGAPHYDRELAMCARRHCLSGVADQIEQDLLDLDPIDHGPFGVRTHVDLELEILRHPEKRQRARLSYRLSQIFDLLPGLPLPYELPQALHDFHRTMSLFRGALNCLLGGFPSSRREQSPDATQVIDERSQRLRNLVGKRGNHLAELIQSCDVYQLRPEFVHPPLAVLVLGQIPDEPGEQPQSGQGDLAQRQFNRERTTVISESDHVSPDPADPALASPEIVRHVFVVRGNERPDVPPDDFLLRTAEQARGRGAERLDSAGLPD